MSAYTHFRELCGLGLGIDPVTSARTGGGAPASNTACCVCFAAYGHCKRPSFSSMRPDKASRF